MEAGARKPTLRERFVDVANRVGERFIRWLDGYFGRHSLVGDIADRDDGAAGTVVARETHGRCAGIIPVEPLEARGVRPAKSVTDDSSPAVYVNVVTRLNGSVIVERSSLWLSPSASVYA